MRLTQEDYRNIERWLNQRTIKDSQLPQAGNLSGNEKVPIVQSGYNTITTIKDIVDTVSKMGLNHFYNVSDTTDKYCITVLEAASYVPLQSRRLGLVITFYTKNGNWQIYQFRGKALSQWNSADCWVNIVRETIDECIALPDEEDITGVLEGHNTYLKFKDKKYNPDICSGKGKTILRKNMVPMVADDTEKEINILTQDMVSEADTIYVIQYDFYLKDNIIIPPGCILDFQGGKLINDVHISCNGKLILNNTRIAGIAYIEDIGNIKIGGNFSRSQLLVDTRGVSYVTAPGIKKYLADMEDIEGLAGNIGGLISEINSLKTFASNINNIIFNKIIRTITVSINNGEKISPDSTGNINLDIDFSSSGTIENLKFIYTEGDDVDSITYNGASKVDIHVADLCINNNGETLFTYNPFKINTETLNLYPLRLIINGESCPYTPTANNIIYNFDELFLDELRSNIVLFSGVAEFEEMPGGAVGFMLKGTTASGVHIGSTTSSSAPMNPLKITLNCTITGVTVTPCIRDIVDDTMSPASTLRASISEDNKSVLIDSVRPVGEDESIDGSRQLNMQTLGTEIKKFNIIITGHKE